MFDPIRTQRLVLRSFTEVDGEDLWRRRNEPEVAIYQDWTVPFPRDRADAIAASVAGMGGPRNGEWWMAVVCDGSSGETLGDVGFHLSDDGHTAEVGYTFAREHWGHGYAVEALEALVVHLFSREDVTRVFGTLHPDNRASAMVLERCGFLFEGHTRLSFWLDGVCSDDWIYGMTRADWEDWRTRPRVAPTDVRFVEITDDNQGDVAELRTHRSQEDLVAPVLVSYGDALFPPVIDGVPVQPWLRAIEADGDLAGFVMMAIPTPSYPEPYLWRLLIDRRHQRRGIGARVLDMLVEECRRHDATTLRLTWNVGKGSPAPFYERNGFVATGRLVGDEVEARRTFT